MDKTTEIDNLRVFVIEKVPNPTLENLLNAERRWMHRTNNMRKIGGPNKVLFRWNNYSRALHYSPSFSLKLNPQQPEIHSTLAVTHNAANTHFPSLPQFRSKLYLECLLNIHKAMEKSFFPQLLFQLTPKTLRHYLNILTNANITTLRSFITTSIASKELILFKGQPAEQTKDLHALAYNFINHNDRVSLTAHFLQHLNLRLCPTKNPSHSHKKKHHLLLTYHASLTTIPFANIFHSSIISLPYPLKSVIEAPIIAYKNTKNLQQLFANFKHTSTTTTEQQLRNPPDCMFCSLPAYKPFVNNFGHIDTPSPEFLKHILHPSDADIIIPLFQLGAKHILKPQFNFLSFFNEFKSQLEKWTAILTEKFPYFNFTLFEQTILDKVQKRQPHLPITSSPINIPQVHHITTNFIHPYINISLVDKAAKNFYFTCIHYEHKTIHFQITGEQLNYYNPELFPTHTINATDTTNRALYELTNKTIEEITEYHTKYVELFDKHPPHPSHIYTSSRKSIKSADVV